MRPMMYWCGVMTCCWLAMSLGCAEPSEADEDMAAPERMDMAQELSDEGGVEDQAPDMEPDQGPERRDLGQGCELASDCASGHCVDSFLGGVCGECSADEDCVWGCDPPTVMGVSSVGPSLCHDGGLGGRCTSQAACQPELICGKNPLTLPFDAPDLRTCNACETDADCDPEQVCGIVPSGDPAAGATFAFTCMPRESVPLGGLCDWEGSGDDACQGVCAVAELSGGFDVRLGVCSECREDTDCDDEQTCKAPVLNPMMAQMPEPAICE